MNSKTALGNRSSNNHSVQPRSAEEHHWLQSTSNLSTKWVSQHNNTPFHKTKIIANWFLKHDKFSSLYSNIMYSHQISIQQNAGFFKFLSFKSLKPTKAINRTWTSSFMTKTAVLDWVNQPGHSKSHSCLQQQPVEKYEANIFFLLLL